MVPGRPGRPRPGALMSAALSVAVAFHDVSAYPDDFDEAGDEGAAAPLLPADDRIWRHPSEIGMSSSAFPLDPIAVRRRWITNQPSRASAWTAGIVGAILATGLVVLGTHLATALTDRTSANSSIETASASLPLSTGPNQQATVTASPSGSFMLSANLSRAIGRVNAAMAVIDATFPDRETRSLALVVAPDGVLLAPASSVAGATSILVTLSDRATYVGSVAAVDGSPHAIGTGLALIKIRANGLATVPVDPANPPSNGQLSLAVSSFAGHAAVTGGTIGSLDTSQSVGGWPLIDAMTVELPTSQIPPGTALLGDGGGVFGIVTGSVGGSVVAVPTWLAMPVAKELLASGKVSHGWLDIKGTTAVSPAGSPDGVLVDSVIGTGAAALAGIRRGDVIVAVQQHRTRTIQALMGRLYLEAAGGPVEVSIIRGKRSMHVPVRLEATARG